MGEKKPGLISGALSTFPAPTVSEPTASDPVTLALAQFFASSLFQVEGRYYRKVRVPLDGYRFIGCRFDECVLISTKGTFSVEGCFFADCRVEFGDEALKIVKLYNIVAREAWEKGWLGVVPSMDGEGAINIQ